MIVRFSSTYGSCHDHDCVRWYDLPRTTYVSCHGHDCMIVRFSSTFDSCHCHDCMIVGFTSTLYMIAVMVRVV